MISFSKIEYLSPRMTHFSNDIVQCYDRIKSYIHRTPVLQSRLVNERAGCSIFFKCENMQRMGAFKMRGAANAILSLSEDERKRGVVTHSSGNFAQAVALSALVLGIDATIVMPSNAPAVKKAAVADYGAQIIECEPTIEAREAATQKVVDAHGKKALHPSNAIEVITGNATAAYELLADYPDLDIVISPVGGGGLLAGTAMAGASFSDTCQVIGAEPMQADDAYQSLKAGHIIKYDKVDTIADGLRTYLGDVNFPIIQSHVQEIIRVEESEIIDAMKFVWERMKIIIEASSAVPVAAIFKKPEIFTGKKVGLIISGGNVDLGALPFTVS